MSRLKRLKSIDGLIENLQTIISQSQCSLSEIELNLLNEAIAKLTVLRSKKGLTDKHYQNEISDILELIYNFLTK
ncbi:hypothetical protein [Chryseobacterium schmidteae]|uniref:hypothetical protein n=1 Tax=Chryseobacterium schmidteae TaxID=2730404 RepID=UPI00158E921B|nr:hypothetical protein [Chryseobacterium schmidteae]